MSRRKQPNPRHLESDQALASSLLHNDELLDSQSDDEGGGDEHICGRCRAEFVELVDFLRHKKQCARKRIVVVFSDDCGSGEAGSDQEDLVSFNSSSYFRDLEYNGDLMNKRNEDLENNNSVVSAFDKDFDNKGGLADDSLDILDNGEKELLQFTRPLQSHLTSTPANLPHLSLPMAGLTGPSLPDSNVSLEALRNTKVAVAQYPSNIMPPPTNDVVVLQSTLYSLQQQQLLQLQLIQQIQLQIGAQKSSSSNAGNNTGGVTSSNYSHSQPLSLSTGGSSTTPPITSSSAIVQPPPNELNQPNSLELLRRSAQQVLNNASQGLLANGLDFSKGKSSTMGSYDHKSGLGRSGSTEPFFKHRCRFCGKVFGSDSALQIHIRSHTGERPFKCNVCGNRFSTRGNLKVHFQRHKAKYPHIRMNPNPVPEHLDRFHPPLIPSEVAAAAAHRQGGHTSDLMASGASSPPLSYPSSLAHLPAIPQSPIPTNSPTPTPLDLGPPKSQSATPNTILPPTSSSSSSTNHELAPTPPRVTESPASLVNKPPSPGAGSEDSHENSLERSLSPVGSMRSEDRDKSLSPVPHGDESSKESLMGSKADSDTPTPDIGAAKHTSPSAVPSPTIMMSRGGPHNQHNHLSSPVTSFSSLLPMSTCSIPTTFSMTHSLSTLSAAGSLHTSTLPLTDPALDPAVYTPLLPKPGSNDNSWESLIEITKTSETSKLQQLVDNIEHKLSDPNQCVICHRVLSCKSALQMHYRTHTGERPFKCKICGRAFTTKGNLKTHMGVHRAKPPVRVLHQCPVCHKKFTNALVLQQHIRMHTGEPTDLSLEQIQAAEVKDYPPTLHPSLPHLMSPPGSGTPPQMGSSPVTLMPSAMMKPSPLPAPNASTSGSGSDLRTPESESVIKSSSSVSEGEKSNDGDSFPIMKADNGNGSLGPVHSVPTSAIVPTFSTSLAALENHVKAINTTIAHHVSAYNALMATSGGGSSMTMHEDSSSPTPTEDSIMNGDKSPEPLSSPIPGMHQGDQSSPDDRSTPSIKVESPSPGITASTASHALSTTPSPASVISMVNSECGNIPGTPLDLTPKASVITSLPSESSGIPTSFAGLPLPPHILQPGNRISTTCNICFKTFACNSALEIHYRSHTKVRPFRCTSCDRSFSTKGNMRQHMLTHKIRDLPPQLFDSKMVTSPHQNVGTENLTTNSSSTSSPSVSNTDAGVKRPMVEGDSFIPIPKRPPGLPKHLCHVCNKNFSSASALQIHMRTHTGDRPFKCTICERAFTTKGNLKVHMGTHMWNNGTSRRGRRMSIDLPPIPLGAKDSEFIQRRPDLYFPFMAAPFMNGLAATKVNEISVIQSATMNNGGLSSPPMGIAPTGNMSCGNVGNSMSSPIGGGGSAPAAGSGGGGGNSGGGGGGNGVIGGMVSNSMGMMTGEMGSGMRSNIPTPTPTPTSTPTPTPPDLDLSMKKPPLMTSEDTPPPQLPPMVAPPMNIVSKPSPSPASPNEDQPTDMSKTASWVWKLACSICSKVCTSSSELDLHVQAHYKPEVKEGLSSPHSDNLAV